MPMEALTRVHHAGVHHLWRHHTGGVHRADLLRVDISRALNDLGGWLLEFTRSGGDPLLLGAVVGAWRCRRVRRSGIANNGTRSG